MGHAARKVAFVIEGDWLTKFVKDRVLEGRWDHAIQTMSCLEGISLEQILTVLKGDAKVTGRSDEEVFLEKDDDQEYKEDLAYQFAGAYIESDGRYFRPYAYVTSWGIEDYSHRTQTTRGSDRHLDRRGNETIGATLYYADDPLRDVAKIVKFEREDNDLGGMTKDGRSFVLFKEVTNFPFQIVDFAGLGNAQKALDEYIKAGQVLKETGYNQTFPPEYYKVRYEVTSPTEPRPEHAKTQPSEKSADAEYDLKAIGKARFDKISATNAGMEVEDWQNYQDRMQGKESIVDQHINRVKKAEQDHDDFEKNYDQYVKKIIAQAGDNWLVLGEINGKEIKVPLAPFENWCLWRGDGAHLALPWTPVCPSGLKMFGDDPYHTDFLVGGGLGLDAMAHHSSPISEMAWDARTKIQEEKLGFEVAVLCGNGKTGPLKAVHPQRNAKCNADEVAIIPNAGPHYVAAAVTAGAIICEKGGTMAHLVTISREKDVKIVRVEKARQLYPEGMHLVVDCSKGKVTVPYNRQDYKMKIGNMVIDVDDHLET